MSLPVKPSEMVPNPTENGSLRSRKAESKSKYPPFPSYAAAPAPASVAEVIAVGRNIRVQHKSKPCKSGRVPPKPARPRRPKATDVHMTPSEMWRHAQCLKTHSFGMTDRMETISKPKRRAIIQLWREYGEKLPAETIGRIRALLDADEPFKPDQAYEYFINLRRTRKKLAATRGTKEMKKGLLAVCGDKRFTWAKNATIALARGFQQRLSRPGRYALADGMLRLSNILLGEFSGFMNMRVPSRKSRKGKSQFLIEMADKVAVWIDEILKESDERMLMMDFDEDNELLADHRGGGGDMQRGPHAPAYLSFQGDKMLCFKLLTSSLQEKGKETFLTYGHFTQTHTEAADELSKTPTFDVHAHDKKLTEQVDEKLSKLVSNKTPPSLTEAMKDKSPALKLLIKKLEAGSKLILYEKEDIKHTHGHAAKELKQAKNMDTEHDDPNLSQEIHSALTNVVKETTPTELKHDMSDTIAKSSKYLSHRAAEQMKKALHIGGHHTHKDKTPTAADFLKLSDKEQQQLISTLTPDEQKKLFDKLDDKEKKKMFDNLDEKGKVDLLARMSAAERDKFLAGLSKEEREKYLALLAARVPTAADFAKLSDKEQKEMLASLTGDEKKKLFDQLDDEGKKEFFHKLDDKGKAELLASMSAAEREKFLASLPKEEREKYLALLAARTTSAASFGKLSDQEQKQLLSTLSPEDKRKLFDKLDDKAKKKLFDNLDEKGKVDLLANMSAAEREKFLASLSKEEREKYLTLLATRVPSTGTFGKLSDEEQKQLLTTLSPAEKKKLFNSLDDKGKKEFFNKLDDKGKAELLANMSAAEREKFLASLSKEEREKYLALLAVKTPTAEDFAKLSDGEQKEILASLTGDEKKKLFDQLDDEGKKEFFHKLDDKGKAELLANMSTAEREKFLASLPKEEREKYLALLSARPVDKGAEDAGRLKAVAKITDLLEGKDGVKFKDMTEEQKLKIVRGLSPLELQVLFEMLPFEERERMKDLLKSIQYAKFRNEMKDLLVTKLGAHGNKVFHTDHPDHKLTHKQAADLLKLETPTEVHEHVKQAGESHKLGINFKDMLHKLVKDSTPDHRQHVMHEVVHESGKHLADVYIHKKFKKLVGDVMIGAMQKRGCEILIDDKDAAESYFFAAQRLKRVKCFDAEPNKCIEPKTREKLLAKLLDTIRCSHIPRHMTGILREYAAHAADYLSTRVMTPDESITAYMVLLNHMEAKGNTLLADKDVPKTFNSCAEYLRRITTLEDKINMSDQSLQQSIELKLKELMADVPVNGYTQSVMNDTIRDCSKKLTSYLALQVPMTAMLRTLIGLMCDEGDTILLRGTYPKSYKDGADLLHGKNTDQLFLLHGNPHATGKIQLKLVKLIEDHPENDNKLMNDVIEIASKYLGVHLDTEPDKIVKICICKRSQLQCCSESALKSNVSSHSYEIEMKRCPDKNQVCPSLPPANQKPFRLTKSSTSIKMTPSVFFLTNISYSDAYRYSPFDSIPKACSGTSTPSSELSGRWNTPSHKSIFSSSLYLHKNRSCDKCTILQVEPISGSPFYYSQSPQASLVTILKSICSNDSPTLCTKRTDSSFMTSLSDSVVELTELSFNSHSKPTTTASSTNAFSCHGDQTAMLSLGEITESSLESYGKQESCTSVPQSFSCHGIQAQLLSMDEIMEFSSDSEVAQTQCTNVINVRDEELQIISPDETTESFCDGKITQTMCNVPTPLHMRDVQTQMSLEFELAFYKTSTQALRTKLFSKKSFISCNTQTQTFTSNDMCESPFYDQVRQISRARIQKSNVFYGTAVQENESRVKKTRSRFYIQDTQVSGTFGSSDTNVKDSVIDNITELPSKIQGTVFLCSKPPKSYDHSQETQVQINKPIEILRSPLNAKGTQMSSTKLPKSNGFHDTQVQVSITNEIEKVLLNCQGTQMSCTKIPKYYVSSEAQVQVNLPNEIDTTPLTYQGTQPSCTKIVKYHDSSNTLVQIKVAKGIETIPSCTHKFSESRGVQVTIHIPYQMTYGSLYSQATQSSDISIQTTDCYDRISTSDEIIDSLFQSYGSQSSASIPQSYHCWETPVPYHAGTTSRWPFSIQDRLSPSSKLQTSDFNINRTVVIDPSNNYEEFTSESMLYEGSLQTVTPPLTQNESAYISADSGFATSLSCVRRTNEGYLTENAMKYIDRESGISSEYEKNLSENPMVAFVYDEKNKSKLAATMYGENDMPVYEQYHMRESVPRERKPQKKCEILYPHEEINLLKQADSVSFSSECGEEFTYALLVSTEDMSDWHAMMISLMWNVKAWHDWIQKILNKVMIYSQQDQELKERYDENWSKFQIQVVTEVMQWRQYYLFCENLTVSLTLRYQNMLIVTASQATREMSNAECQEEMMNIVRMLKSWTTWFIIMINETNLLKQGEYQHQLHLRRWKYLIAKMKAHLREWYNFKMHLKLSWIQKYGLITPEYVHSRNSGPIWVVSACGMVPSGAAFAGVYNGEQAWVARTTHRREVWPAMLVSSLGCCIVHDDDDVHRYNKYQVMCNARVSWLPWRAGEISPEAVSAARGVHVGRVLIRGSHALGAVLPPDYTCQVIVFKRPFTFTSYELLVSENSEL